MNSVLLYLLNASDTYSTDRFDRFIRRTSRALRDDSDAAGKLRIWCLYHRGSAGTGANDQLWVNETRCFQITAGLRLASDTGTAFASPNGAVQEFLELVVEQLQKSDDCRFSMVIGGHGFGPAGVFLDEKYSSSDFASDLLKQFRGESLSTFASDLSPAELEATIRNNKDLQREFIKEASNWWMKENHRVGTGICSIWGSASSANSPTLSISKLRVSIESVGLKLDCLIFNSCLMSSLEVLYELESVTRTILAFEGRFWGMTNPPHWIGLFGAAQSHEPNMLAKEFMRLERNSAFGRSILVAVDLSELRMVVESMNGFADALTDFLPRGRELIECAFDPVVSITVGFPESFQVDPTYLADVGQFCRNLLFRLSRTEPCHASTMAAKHAGHVLNTITHGIYRIDIKHSETTGPIRFEGTSVYFPKVLSDRTDCPIRRAYFGNDLSQQILFARETRWGSFLSKWFRIGDRTSSETRIVK